MTEAVSVTPIKLMELLLDLLTLSMVVEAAVLTAAKGASMGVWWRRIILQTKKKKKNLKIHFF